VSSEISKTIRVDYYKSKKHSESFVILVCNLKLKSIAMLDEIYYDVDEFCKKNVEEINKGYKVFNICKKKHPCSLCLSEVMTIIIYYHHSGYRNFKAYYLQGIKGVFNSDFPSAPSYNRFIELMRRAEIPLYLFVKEQCHQSQKTGIYFIDSTKLPVCYITRAHSHKVFRGFAAKGKTSTGWFYGLKLHLIINNLGQLINFNLTSGNKADNDVVLLFNLTKRLIGTFYCDAGYQLKEEKKLILELNTQKCFIVKPRSNMKNAVKPLLYKDFLWHKKRSVIETVIDIQKEHLDLKINRNRSATNGFVTILANMAAYCFYKNKPSVVISPIYQLNSGSDANLAA
jgi:hypothetical protein